MNYGDWRRWLIILQTLFFVFCKNEIDNSEKIVVQGCVESELNLSCNDTKEIEILTVVLGDSHCKGRDCCIRANDCMAAPSDEYVSQVKSICNGQRNCAVKVSSKWMKCSLLGVFNWNDFERIIFICKYQTGLMTTRPLPSDRATSSNRSTDGRLTNSFTGTPSSGGDGGEAEAGKTDKNEHESGGGIQTDDSHTKPIVLGIICFIIFVIIVVLIIVIARRRKRWPPVKYEMEMSNAVYANDNQPTANHTSNSQPDGTNAANTTSIYDRPRSVVYSVVAKTDSMVQENQTNLYCDVEEKDTDHPRDNVYSIVRNSGYVGHGSPDGDIYDDVETKENVKTRAVKHDTETYEEACEWKGQDSKKQKQGNGSTGVKLTSAGKAQNEFTKINNPLPSSSSKAFYMNTGEIANESPSPVYEPMSAGGGSEGIYANEPVLSSPRSLSGRGSDTDSQYCAMQSPRVQLKDDGMQIVVDNELYGSK